MCWNEGQCYPIRGVRLEAGVRPDHGGLTVGSAPKLRTNQVTMEKAHTYMH